MTARKINKSERHMARSTPDKIQTTFNYMDDNYQMKYNEWLKRFSKRMRIKHNDEHSHLNVYMEENDAKLSNSNEVTVVVEYVKD